MTEEVRIRAQTLAGLVLAIGILAIPSLAAPGVAVAQALVPDGQIRCSVSGGFGYVVTSQNAVNCTWRRFDGSVEFYLGSIGKVGDPGSVRPCAVTAVREGSRGKMVGGTGIEPVTLRV